MPQTIKEIVDVTLKSSAISLVGPKVGYNGKRLSTEQLSHSV